MAEIKNPTLKIGPAPGSNLRVTVSYTVRLSNTELIEIDDGRIPFYMLDKASIRGLASSYGFDLNFEGEIPRTTEETFREATVDLPRHWFDTDSTHAHVHAEIVVFAAPKIGGQMSTNVVLIRSLKPRPYVLWHDVGKLASAAAGAVAAGAIAFGAYRMLQNSRSRE